MSDVPRDSNRRLLEESGFVFFVLLVDGKGGYGKINIFFPRVGVETL